MLVTMSRPRTRPTREETRDRLLRAAARVFVTKGAGAASIEDICDEAGFSRGAFYSNFAAKDELIIELLEVHTAANTAELDRLYASSDNPTDFVENIESSARRRTGPLDLGEDGGVLYVELLLFALRNPENRPRLLAHHRRLRETNLQMLAQIEEAEGRKYPAPLEDIVSLIMAIDIGLNLNHLVDPESHQADQFSELVGLLQRLWLASPPAAQEQ